MQTIPQSRDQERPQNYNTIPLTAHEGAEILGPVLPRVGKPAWFSIRLPVHFRQQHIGTISLRARLASVTELTSSLVVPDVYEPQLIVFERFRLTPVGTEAQLGETLASSTHIVPGWKLHLVKGNENYQEPQTNIRYLLMIAAALSAFGITLLFYQMSQRLSRYLQSLSEGARAVANGNFGISVSEDVPGELGVLARAYNRMRDQLGELVDSRVDVERRAALGNMAAGIAHEIRNPLTTVSATVHGLKSNEKDQQRLEMFDVIASEITRVDQTISEFLNYARPKEPVREKVSIGEAFRSIQTLIATTAHKNNVLLSLSGDMSLKLEVDVAQLHQILLNLTLNYVQAMPDGGHLTLRAYRDGNDVIIEITDDGHGIDLDEQDKVLRPFYTTRTDGSGLGLSITSQLLEANQGLMEIQSETGVGTTVTLSFQDTSHTARSVS